MAADPDRDGETERTRRARVIKVTLAAFGGFIPLVIAIAQLVEYIQSGKLNYVLFAILILMAIVGIAILLTMNKRRAPRVVAIIMLAITVAGVFFFFFVTARPPRGTFTNPPNGQHVSEQFLLAVGNVEDFSSALSLQCILKNDTGIYFFYDAQSANSRWTAGVGLGPSSINRPFTFTLILATATQSVVDEIRRREKNDPKYYEEGWGPNLPPGIETLAEIVIVRDP